MLWTLNATLPHDAHTLYIPDPWGALDLLHLFDSLDHLEFLQTSRTSEIQASMLCDLTSQSHDILFSFFHYFFQRPPNRWRTSCESTGRVRKGKGRKGKER